MTEMAKAYGAMSDVFGEPQGLLQYIDMMVQCNMYIGKLATAKAPPKNPVF